MARGRSHLSTVGNVNKTHYYKGFFRFALYPRTVVAVEFTTACHNVTEPILEVSVNTTFVFFILVIRVLNGFLRTGSIDTEDSYIYYFHKSGNVKPEAGGR